MVSTPIRFARQTGGALDVYFHDPAAAVMLDPDQMVVVAAHIAAILNRSGAEDNGDPVSDPGTPETAPTGSVHPDGWGRPGPRWARGRVAEHRNGVWIAAGMLIGDEVTDTGDAVALLRAHAFSTGRSVDDIAADLVARTITPDDLRGPGRTTS